MEKLNEFSCSAHKSKMCSVSIILVHWLIKPDQKIRQRRNSRQKFLIIDECSNEASSVQLYTEDVLSPHIASTKIRSNNLFKSLLFSNSQITHTSLCYISNTLSNYHDFQQYRSRMFISGMCGKLLIYVTSPLKILNKWPSSILLVQIYILTPQIFILIMNMSVLDMPIQRSTVQSIIKLL